MRQKIISNNINPFSLVLFIFLLATSLPAYTQTPPIPAFDIDIFVQDLFQQQDKNINYDDFYESLYQFYINPLDLNLATKEDLQSLYILSEIQIKSFLEYRIAAGDLLSLYELQVIPYFDPLTCYKILPFAEVTNKFMQPKELWSKMRREKNNYLLLRYSGPIENNKKTPEYAGTLDNLYARFRSSHSKDYSLGVTFEKDAGEKTEWNPSAKKYGADFISSHFTLFNKGRFKGITLGDYQLQFGQGLILSSGFSVGKGAETVATTRKSNIGIRSYTSVLESGFFRGSAFTFSLHRNLDITGFYSNINRDARINSDSLYEDFFVTSISSSGYHRTSQEIAARKKVNEQAMGGNLSYQNHTKDLHIGFTFVNAHYQVPIIRSATVYNQFAFEGNNNFNSSMDYSYVKNNFNFFGEAAVSQNGGKALLSGCIASLSSQTEMAMIYRNYGKDFQSIYGNAFGENTNNNNEQGIYWGIKIKPFYGWTFSAYYDLFKFPWLRYQADAPSNGYEYLTRINYQPTKLILIYLQMRRENKEKNQANNFTNIDFITPSIKTNYMINLDYKAKEYVSFKSRVQMSSYRQTNSPTFGYFIMEEIDFDFKKVKFCSRYALFDTDDYDNRQYSYEKDVLYSFTIPALYGKGSRLYLLFQLKVIRNIDLWIKYSKTTYFGKNSHESIQDKSDIKLELRYGF